MVLFPRLPAGVLENDEAKKDETICQRERVGHWTPPGARGGVPPMFEEGKPQKGVTDGRSTTLSLSKTSRAKNGTVEGERARKDAPKTAQKEKIAADHNSKFISAKMALRDVL